MSKQMFVQGVLTIALVVVSLALLTSANPLYIELGKGVTFLSVISVFPLAQAMATAQAKQSRSITMEPDSMEQEKVA